MDGRLDGLKQWKCPNGHVIGVIDHVSLKNGQGKSRHVSRLLLFRHAVDLSQSNLMAADVVGDVEGTMLHIKCDVAGCGAIRSWWIGEDALERLLEQLGMRPRLNDSVKDVKKKMNIPMFDK